VILIRKVERLINFIILILAAHCIRDKGSVEALTIDDIFVLLGRYDLKRTAERHSSQHLVNEIILHPSWKHYAEKFDADIAILVLEEAVKYTNYIRPACLPDAEDAAYLGNGTIVGWGKTEHSNPINRDMESIPRKAVVEAIDAAACYTSDYGIARISSLRTFCAGGSVFGGKGPCR